MGSSAGVVLLVDDEPNNTDMLRRRLERSSFNVDVAHSGPEALDRVAANQYDIMLLDMMMPGMDGLEVLERLRSSSEGKAMPVIMVTAKSDGETVVAALDGGADDYVTKPVDFKVLLSRLQSQLGKSQTKRSLEDLNRNLNDEVERRTEKLTEAVAQLQGVADSLPAVIWQAELSADGKFRLLSVNGSAEALLGADREAIIDNPGSLLALLEEPERLQILGELLRQIKEKEDTLSCEIRLPAEDMNNRWLYLGGRVRSVEPYRIDGVLLDITERKHLEVQLLHTQKLESVGQLASGIAHEINSPAQYTRDNIGFLKDSFDGLMAYLTLQSEILSRHPEDLSETEATELERLGQEIDLDFLTSEVPEAIDQGLHGIERISKIVTAMKGFTHPGSENPESCDINKLIENTTIVARNEWKYVAELELNLDPALEFVSCFPSELGQVVLNLLVNGAHAIAEKRSGTGSMGKVVISTASAEDRVEIRITDDGPGVPAALQNRIFDPFFTTKAVGKGTGQGLAIARSVIVDKHKGELLIENTGPDGTTFLITIPADPVGNSATADEQRD